MRHFNVLPIGLAGAVDDLVAVMGSPPYITAEGNLIAYYGANSTVTGYSICVGKYPERYFDSLINDDNKTVNTFRKAGKNQFQKYGAVIVPGAGGEPDNTAVLFPSAVYNEKTKKFMVYYIAVGAGVYSICLATGSVFNQLNKYGAALGVATPVITLPGSGVTISNYVPLHATYNKEENRYKIYYSVTDGVYQRTCVASSQNGFDF
jgi:hypothetical protein